MNNITKFQQRLERGVANKAGLEAILDRERPVLDRLLRRRTVGALELEEAEEHLFSESREHLRRARLLDLATNDELVKTWYQDTVVGDALWKEWFPGAYGQIVEDIDTASAPENINDRLKHQTALHWRERAASALKVAQRRFDELHSPSADDDAFFAIRTKPAAYQEGKTRAELDLDLLRRKMEASTLLVEAEADYLLACEIARGAGLPSPATQQLVRVDLPAVQSPLSAEQVAWAQNDVGLSEWRDRVPLGGIPEDRSEILSTASSSQNRGSQASEGQIFVENPRAENPRAMLPLDKVYADYIRQRAV